MPRLRSDGFRGWLWEIPDAGEHAPIPETPYPDFVTKLLRRRGIADAQSAAEYLFDRELPPADPLTIPGATEAIDRIEQAIHAGESIAVYGDFDVDGITSAAILTEAIRATGGSVRPYIPDRFSEGYGINRAALEHLRRDQNVTLVVTADCGITARDEIAAAGAMGQDVIIVDHHSVPPLLPDCAAIVNPKFDPESQFADHSSGGVAYRIAPRLLERFGRAAAPEQWLDLATLSTIADVVPLRASNRRLVRDGLVAIRNTPRPGLRALLEVSGLWNMELDSDSVGYALAPRINAAGRLAHAELALTLLLTTDPTEAQDAAAELDRLNLRRRRLTTEAMACAATQLQNEDAALPITFIGDAQISSGIVGLVAGRLAEERHRPAFVYEQGAEESRASCRSIPGFDVAAALRACDDLLLRHGGHAMAAGFTVRTDLLPALKARLAAQASEALTQERLQARIVIDAQTPLDRVGASQIAWLRRLAPFGESNPAPTFLSTGVTVADARRVGGDATHLRLTLRAGEATWQGIGFGLGAAPVASRDAVDLVWTLKRNALYGSMELEVRDIAPATAG